MAVETHISETAILAKFDARSKKRLIEKLAEMFADAYECIDKDTLYEKLIERERLGSTGIGEGISLPHCRFKTQGKTLCGCITLEHPVDFDAIDNQPIDLVFAMIVPLDADEQHLENLAHVAQILQNPKNTQQLRAATDRSGLYNTLSQTQPSLLGE